jgi:integrase
MTKRKPTGAVRSMPVACWSAADRAGWEDACRPSVRLQRGGRASHLAPVTRDDLASRYGFFVDFLDRTSRLDLTAGPAAQVTPDNVAEYVPELQSRLSSVTVRYSIYKLRRAAELISGRADFAWLAEIEKDLALVMIPKSKRHRLVTSDLLVEAGLTLIEEVQGLPATIARARAVRNGLMIALLAVHPIRLKNFVALQIGRSFVKVKGSWWVKLDQQSTKSRRVDERTVPDFLQAAVEIYLRRYRPLLARIEVPSNALWLSSKDGSPMTYAGIQPALAVTTHATVGVNVSAHLFRMAAATTAAIHGGSTPHLASAVLHHTDPRVTEAHYNRATSMSAGQTYRSIVDQYR